MLLSGPDCQVQHLFSQCLRQAKKPTMSKRALPSAG
uniref:Uncharacterized protein n=1 Tax=Anguilla anguilla TaxID=7936 RepID=A0A0E9R204_ANGAN